MIDKLGTNLKLNQHDRCLEFILRFFYIYIQDVECQKSNNENKSYERTVIRLNKPNCHERLFVFFVC